MAGDFCPAFRSRKLARQLGACPAVSYPAIAGARLLFEAPSAPTVSANLYYSNHC